MQCAVCYCEENLKYWHTYFDKNLLAQQLTALRSTVLFPCTSFNLLWKKATVSFSHYRNFVIASCFDEHSVQQSCHGRLARWIKWRTCDVEKRKKGWRLSCDVDKATEGLENELWRRWSDGKVGEWAKLNLSVTSPTSKLILQPFRRFTYITAHSPTLLLLRLRHSSFSNPSFASLRHKFFT